MYKLISTDHQYFSVSDVISKKSSYVPNFPLLWRWTISFSEHLRLPKKWSFLLSISLVNVNKLFTFTKEILYGKLHFLCRVRLTLSWRKSLLETRLFYVIGTSVIKELIETRIKVNELRYKQCGVTPHF